MTAPALGPVVGDLPRIAAQAKASGVVVVVHRRAICPFCDVPPDAPHPAYLSDGPLYLLLLVQRSIDPLVPPPLTASRATRSAAMPAAVPGVGRRPPAGD
jgi:hypothetical protein